LLLQEERDTLERKLAKAEEKGHYYYRQTCFLRNEYGKMQVCASVGLRASIVLCVPACSKGPA
jgi:hypothetical protein